MSEEKKGLIRGALRRVLLEKGGPGSGHPGHRGRQGTRGGSLPKAAGTHPGGRGVPDFSDMEKRAFISEKTRVVDGQTIYAIVSLRRMVVYRDKPYRMETSTGRRGGKFTSTAQERVASELAAELLDEVTTRLTLEGWKKNERGYWLAPWGPQTMKRIRLTTRQAPDRTLGELLTYLDDDGILFVPRDVTGFDYMERQRNKDHDAYWLKKIRRLRNDFYDRNFEAVPEDEPYPYEGPSYDEWLLEQQVEQMTEPPELPPAEEPPAEEVEAPIAEEGAPAEGGLGGEIPLPEEEPLSGDKDEELEEELPLALRILGALRRIITRGGEGSGHHGHRGRVGEVGGSEPGKGAPRGKVTGTGIGVAQEPGAYVKQPKLAPEQIGPSVLRKMKRILNPTTSIHKRDNVPFEDWKTVLHEARNGEWAEGETFAGGIAKDGMRRWEGEEIYGEEGDPGYELDESALDDHLHELNYENVQSFMVDQWDSVENEARREVDAEVTTYEDIQNLLGMTEDEFIHYGEADIKNAIELEVQRRAIAMLVSRSQLEVAALEQIESLSEYLPGGQYEGQISAARRGDPALAPEDVVNRFNSLINTTRYEIAEEYLGEVTPDDINIDQFLTPVEQEREVIGYEEGGYMPSAAYVELLGYDGSEPVCAAQLRRQTIDLDDIPDDVLAQIEAKTGLSRDDVSRDFFVLNLIQSKRAHEGYGSEMIMEILGMAAEENRGLVGSATMSAAMFYAKLGAVGYSEVFQTEGGTAFWTADQVSEAYEWLQSEAARIAAGGEVPETYAQEVGVPRPVATVEASTYGSMRRVIIERDPGGEGSGHKGHRGRIGEVGGSEPGKGAPRVKAPSKIQVGITSATPGKASRTVFKEMNEFKKRMSEIKGVKNLSVQPGLGGWEGGTEPTWVVTYSGDGDALRLIADTARQHNQEAVLLMRECLPPQDCSPVVDFSFADPVTPDERTQVDNLLVQMGIGGWTWFRDGEGGRVLRSVAVPQWGGQRQAHLSASRRLRKMFDAIDMPHEYAENETWVDVMEREGDYAYEAVLTP